MQHRKVADRGASHINLLRLGPEPCVALNVTLAVDEIAKAGGIMKKPALLIVTMALCSLSWAQVGTTVKQGAKATGEKAQQAGDAAKAAVSSQPDKSVDEAKAKSHKAKAHHHAKAAKKAAEDIPK